MPPTLEAVQCRFNVMSFPCALLAGGFPAMNRFVRQKIYDALLAMRSSFSADFNTLLQSLHGETNTLLQSLHTQGGESPPTSLPMAMQK